MNLLKRPAKILFSRGSKLFMTVLLVATVGPQILSVNPVSADTGGYPWWDAPCVWNGTTTGLCSGFVWGEAACPLGDGFCTPGNQTNGYYQYDQWGEEFRNCVSYVAWKVNQTFGINPTSWGNGADWNNSAIAHGYSDDTSPQIGDVAQWDGTASNKFGHVAYVFNVVNGVASYAEYNYALDGNFLSTYTSTTQGAPSHYIHIGAITPASSYLITRTGSTVQGKAGLNDAWTTLTTGAVDVQAAGTRIAFRDGGGNIVAKDTLGGSWFTIPAPVDQYVVTPNLLVIRASGAVYAKATLSDNWTTVASNAAIDIKASGNRIAWLDSFGTLWTRDGVSGTSVSETSGVTQYAVTPTLLLVRQGGTLSGKAGLGDAWTTLTTGATDFQAAGMRIAFRDGSGNVVAKDTLSGIWYTNTAPIDQFVVSANLLLIRFGSSLYGKVNLPDALATLTTGDNTVTAAGSRIAIQDASGFLDAKDNLGGTWFTETGAVDQYIVTDSSSQ